VALEVSITMRTAHSIAVVLSLLTTALGVGCAAPAAEPTEDDSSAAQTGSARAPRSRAGVYALGASNTLIVTTWASDHVDYRLAAGTSEIAGTADLQPNRSFVDATRDDVTITISATADAGSLRVSQLALSKTFAPRFEGVYRRADASPVVGSYMEGDGALTVKSASADRVEFDLIRESSNILQIEGVATKAAGVPYFVFRRGGSAPCTLNLHFAPRRVVSEVVSGCVEGAGTSAGGVFALPRSP
jgi:hypothetical protein